MGLKSVVPPRFPSRFVRICSALAATRPARFVSRHLSWKLDPFLLRITGGRLASTLVFPTALLETRGARTGLVRRNAVIYFSDADRFVVIASHAGAPRHPAWLHKVRANPDAASLGGIPMLVCEVDDEHDERRLWDLADRVFPAFADYREEAERAARRIPILVLVPR